jgi:predicted small metal-binding protein
MANVSSINPGRRKVADCRDFPSETNCTLTISGQEDEVVRAATEHAISVHGHKDSPELREQIRKMLKDESAPSDEPKILHQIA